MKRFFLSVGIAVCASLVTVGIVSAQDRTQARQRVTFAVLKTHRPDLTSLSTARITVSVLFDGSVKRPSEHMLISNDQSIAGWVRFPDPLPDPVSKTLIITVTD